MAGQHSLPRVDAAAPARRVLLPRDMPLPPAAGGGGASVQAMAGRTMGTTWSVKLTALPAALPNVRRRVEQQLESVVGEMSTWEPDSDVSRFNRAAAGTWHQVPAHFFTVLSCALAIAEDSGGAYDPAVGSLVDLWGFGPSGPCRVPPPAIAAEAARRRCGWHRLKLDPQSRRVLQPGGVQLDLSSVAKGFAVDLVSEQLERLGVRSYLVEIGGELRGRGLKPDGNPWWVALERPSDASGPDAGGALPETVVALHDVSIATSGDYRRSFEHEGRRYSHTIDPRTGRPVAHSLASVTVLHRDCMRADALATAMTVLGVGEAMDYARGRGLAAHFVVRSPKGLRELMSPALADLLLD